MTAARKRSFPLFEVPYELPFIAITERAFAQLVNERYEMLQRNMAGDVLAEALTGHLYPEELQARLRPFGIGEQVAVLAFSLDDPGAAAAPLERALEAERAHSLVAIRAGLLCAVIDAEGKDPIALAAQAARRAAGALRRGARVGEPRRRGAVAAAELPRGALRAGGGAPAERQRPRGRLLRDLGAFQLLLSLQDDDALMSYCRGVLGPVEQDEGDYGEELLRSLDVFIEHNGHWEKAASALFCHRHTLRYRVRRVEQLTGRDFSSARDRIEFWLPAGRAARCEGRGSCGKRIERNRIPSEIKSDEYRIAITPAGVRELTSRGHEVLVQAGAGEGSAMGDEQFRRRARGSCAMRRRCSARPSWC